jgi:hypothetical protein
VAQARVESVESRSVRWQVIGWGFSLATLVLAVPGARALARRHVDITVPLALLLGVTVELALSWGNQRFRLAAEPVLAVLAAAFVSTLVVPAVRRRRSGRGPSPSSQSGSRPARSGRC